jgi:hypothetical protein
MWVMARNAAGGFWSHVRACARIARCRLGGAPSLLAGLLLVSLSLPAVGQTADPVKGEASFAAADGYARLVLKLALDVPSEVTTAGSIVMIRFAQPVDIPVDQLSDAVPDYVASARRDPDGSVIRLSLARRVTINTMSAGERIFIDFLPDARCACSAPRPRRRSVRRSASALWCSRPSCALCSRCPTASAPRRS